MKRVVKRVWAFAAEARPRTVVRNFMMNKSSRFDKTQKRKVQKTSFC